MVVNQKAVKVINKIFEAGITEEKDISAMTLDEILEIQGITVAEIGMINDLQKAIKANKVSIIRKSVCLENLHYLTICV